MKYGPRDLLYDNDKGEMVHKRWNKNYVDPKTGKKFGKYIESTDGSLHDIQWMREQEKAAGRAPDQARKDMYKNIRAKAAKLTNPFGIRTKLSEFGGRMYKAGSEPFKKAWNGYTTKSGKQVAGVKKIGRFARDAAKKGAKKAANFSLEATKIAGKLALAGAFSPITAGYFAAKGGKKLINLAENKLPAMIEKGKNEIGKFASWVASSDTVKNAKKGIRSVKKGIGTAKKAISDEVGLIYKEGKENVARRYGAAKKAVGNQIEKLKNLPKKAWNSKVVKKARFNVETTKEILQKRASDKISDISKAVGGYADSVVGWFSRKKKDIVKELDKVTIHGTELTKIPGALAKQAETEAATIFGMVRSGGAQLAQSGPIQAMMSGVRTAGSVAVAPFKAVGGMGMELYRSGAHALESIGKAGAEAAEEVGEKAAESKATFTSFKDMRSKIVKEAKGGLQKFKSLATKAISFITSNETVQKFLGGDGGGKLAEKFKGVLEKVGPKEFASIAKKAAKATAKVAGTAVTLGLSQLAFSAYDAYSGVTDAAEMWGVLPEDCTTGMKTAAAILNVIMGLGPMVYVDLAFEAVYLGTSMLGQSDPINIKREILLMIYECLPDSYDEEEVKGLQDKANSDYENYLMEQYKQMTGATDEQIAGMSAEQKKQAMEQAQQNGAKSKDDYLAEKNDAHTPVMDEIRGTTLGSWLFGSNDENGNYQPGFFSNAKDFLLGNRKKGQKSVFGRVSDALFGTGEEDENGDVDKGIIGTAKEKIYGFVTGIGNFFGDIGDFLFKKSMDEKLAMLWKYFIGGNDKNGEYQIGVLPKIWGKIQDFGNGVMKFFDDLGSKFKGALNVLKSDNQNGFNLLTAPFTILANVARGMLGLDMTQNPIKDSISQFLHMDAFGPFTTLFNWLGTTFDNTIGWAAGELEKKGLIEGTWSIIKGMWSGIWGWIDSGSTGSAIELVSSSLSDMTSGISNTFHNVMKWFKELYDGVSKADTLGAKFDVVKNMLKGLFGVKPDEDFLSTAFGKMQKAIGGAFDTIKKKWNDIKDWWDKFDPKQIFWDAMKKTFPKFSEVLDDTKARWEREHPEGKGTGIYSGSGYSRTATIRGAGNIMKSYGFNPNASGSGNSEYGTYTQNDSAWGSKRTIANGSMSQVGCGPTTLANGMNSAFGLNMTPMQAANLIQPGDLPADGSPGVTANYFPEAVNGLGGEYIGLDPNNPRSVEAALQSGFTMVAGGKSMDNGTSQAFTAGGHYTMLKGGYTKGGIPYTYSYDPLGGNREKPIALDRVLRDVNREGGPNMIGMIAPKGTDASAFGGVSFNNPMYQYNGFGSGTGDSVDKIGLFTQNFATIMKDYAMAGLLGKPYTGSVLNDGSNHSSSNSSSSSTVNPGNVSGDYKGIVNGLMQLGFTKVAAAGIAGNIMQESTMDPNADNGSHHGLVQWDHANRWASAVAWCQSHGLDPNSIAGQLAYVAEECKQSGLFDQMNACSSPEEAARLFEAEFERSGGSEVGKRINYANEAFAQAGGSGLHGGSGLSRVKNIVSRYIGRRSSGTGTDNWTEQTGGVSSDGAQPQTMAMLDDLGAWFKGKTGHKLVVTAITNGSHASGEFSHANGWKADVNDWSGPEGLTGKMITLIFLLLVINGLIHYTAAVRKETLVDITVTEKQLRLLENQIVDLQKVDQIHGLPLLRILVQLVKIMRWQCLLEKFTKDQISRHLDRILLPAEATGISHQVKTLQVFLSDPSQWLLQKKLGTIILSLCGLKWLVLKLVHLMLLVVFLIHINTPIITMLD